MKRKDPLKVATWWRHDQRNPSTSYSLGLEFCFESASCHSYMQSPPGLLATMVKIIYYIYIYTQSDAA